MPLPMPGRGKFNLSTNYFIKCNDWIIELLSNTGSAAEEKKFS
jgi:hypothetical protein